MDDDDDNKDTVAPLKTHAVPAGKEKVAPLQAPCHDDTQNELHATLVPLILSVWCARQWTVNSPPR